MKRTVRYREIDGKRIVIGFGVVMIDPMETKRKATEALRKDKLVKDLETAFGEMQESSSFDLMFKVAALRKRYEQKLHDTGMANPVYLRMVDEYEISDEEYERLSELCGKHKHVTVEGEILGDDTTDG